MVRLRRRELDISQEALAERLGVTFQQIQKYERGANRISAGRLYELARVLETNIPFFYRGYEEVSRAVRRGMAEDGDEFNAPIDTDAADLLAAFRSIKDPELRKSILAMVKKQAKALAGTSKKSR
jgi:transcriptional regulator with XRE-family HTH domain